MVTVAVMVEEVKAVGMVVAETVVVMAAAGTVVEKAEVAKAAAMEVAETGVVVRVAGKVEETAAGMVEVKEEEVRAAGMEVVVRVVATAGVVMGGGGEEVASVEVEKEAVQEEEMAVDWAGAVKVGAWVAARAVVETGAGTEEVVKVVGMAVVAKEVVVTKAVVASVESQAGMVEVKEVAATAAE